MIGHESYGDCQRHPSTAFDSSDWASALVIQLISPLHVGAIKTPPLILDIGRIYHKTISLSLGLGNYPQEASQYGPTRGGLADGAFGGVGAATAGAAGVPTSAYGVDPGGYPSVSMYDGVGRGSAGGGSNSSRGYHPYGR